MNVTHDIIAAVTGPGWKYGLSRILLDEDGNGAVFIAGSTEPFASFTADKVSTSRGNGNNADGEITWRRRGSSCQYKLAKCKVSTETMKSWWTDSLQTEDLMEEGRRLASERDDLIAKGVDPSLLAVPLAPTSESLEDLL